MCRVVAVLLHVIRFTPRIAAARPPRFITAYAFLIIRGHFILCSVVALLLCLVHFVVSYYNIIRSIFL